MVAVGGGGADVRFIYAGQDRVNALRISIKQYFMRQKKVKQKKKIKKTVT